MVLIFSKVQRCNVTGAPKVYGYNEQFEAPQALAEQLVGAGVAGYVNQPNPAPVEIPEPEPVYLQEEPADESEQVQETPHKKRKR